MNVFKGYHPVVNFIYIVFIMIFSISCLHPLCVLINLVCSVSYLIMKDRTKLKFAIPFIVIMTIIYLLHNHEGITILAYFPDGNPLTLESVVYGLLRAVSISNVICWCISFSAVMTTDKLIYLSGRLSPSASLLFSMILRFLPRFFTQAGKVVTAQRCIGRDIHSGSIIKRVKTFMNIFSIMITWSAENAIDISDSMKAKGYGASERTSFSLYSFHKRDVYALAVIVLLGIYDLLLISNGEINYRYFPAISVSAENPVFFAAHFILCMVPAVIETSGAIKTLTKSQ